jgi:hypothetical protein
LWAAAAAAALTVVQEAEAEKFAGVIPNRSMPDKQSQ